MSAEVKTASASDRLKRLSELRLKRNEARKLNHLEVVEEDRKNKFSKSLESRRKQAEWEDEQEKFKKKCLEEGVDPEERKLMDVSADMAEKAEARRKRKQNPADTGFASFEQSTVRQYQRLTKQLKVDFKKYEEEKELLGEEAFYPESADVPRLSYRKDSQEAIDRLAKDVEDQAQRREKFSRRRPFDPDSDVNFINERNKKFNQKLERFYGQYTQEIKQNLERGTAV